jgi:hypothetical protein
MTKSDDTPSLLIVMVSVEVCKQVAVAVSRGPLLQLASSMAVCDCCDTTTNEQYWNYKLPFLLQDRLFTTFSICRAPAIVMLLENV